MTPLRAARVSGALALTVGLLSACGDDAGTDATTAGGEVTISNCGTDASFPSPAERMYVGGDGNLLSMVLSLGAQDQVAGVSGLSDTKALSTAYGTDVVDALPVATTDYPTMENVIAQKPDVMLAGWNYGYSEEKKLTPDLLADRDIAGYVLSESCRQADGKRGTMAPWEALSADIDNLGKITGHEEEAEEAGPGPPFAHPETRARAPSSQARRSSGNSAARPSSGVQSLYLPTTGPRYGMQISRLRSKSSSSASTTPRDSEMVSAADRSRSCSRLVLSCESWR